MDFGRIWASASLARKVMTAALVLLFVSQFFPYMDDTSSAQLLWDSDFNTQMNLWIGGDYGNGWYLHPQAYVIIAGLVLVYLNDFSETPLWSRFGWWLTVALVLVAAVPLTTREIGGVMGLVSIGLALVAAILNQRERKAVSVAVAKPPA